MNSNLYEQMNKRRREAELSPLSERDWLVYLNHVRLLAGGELGLDLTDEDIAEFAVLNRAPYELEALFRDIRFRREAEQMADEAVAAYERRTR